MSTETKRKPNEELYTYSWYLPVGGNDGQRDSQGGGQGAGVVEQQAETAASESSASTATPEELGSPGSRSTHTTYSVRLVGLVFWSAATGVGLIVLLGTQSPVHMANVGALAGVWAAISALIWFLPGKLMK